MMTVTFKRRAKFYLLSPEQKQNVGNGCGPGFFPTRVKDRFFNWLFPESCAEHDFNYYVGGFIVARLFRDVIFGVGMMVKTLYTALDFQVAKALVRLLTFPIFYLSVRAFGWLRNDYGFKHRTEAEVYKLSMQAKAVTNSNWMSRSLDLPRGWDIVIRLADMLFVACIEFPLYFRIIQRVAL